MLLRFSIFISVFIAFYALEHLMARRKNSFGVKRQVSNSLLLVIGSFFAQFLFKFSPIAVSSFAANQDIGLFNWFGLSGVLEIVCGVVLLDMIIYFQHRYFHYSNFFWKFHKVHHVDNLLDVTTALRFHPIEILLSFFIKSLSVLVLGLSVDSVIIFEIILSSMAIFNHANIQLPKWIEYYLSFILVTPNFHVIHHHPKSDNHNSNFGFNLSVWDYIFKSYRESSTDDFRMYPCGLENEMDNSLKGMLMSPFRKDS